MEQSLIIGFSAVLVIVLFLAIHSWLHRILKFKMDESSILKSLHESDSGLGFLATEAISNSTEIAKERVRIVCDQSKAIKKQPNEIDSWCLKSRW